MVAMPGIRAPELMPMAMDSILAKYGRCWSTTAEDNAGSELTPDNTQTPAARAAASSVLMPQTKARPSARSR